MRILFIIIQALFILTGCTAVQDGRGRNIQNESADQRDAKPIHVKNTAPETAENPGRTDIAKHLVEVTEKIPKHFRCHRSCTRKILRCRNRCG